MCELTSATGIVYKINVGFTGKSYIGETERSFSNRYNITKKELTQSKVGHCLIFRPDGSIKTALSNKDIVKDIGVSPETVNVEILEQNINCQEERIRKENKYIQKFDTIFNGYNKKISVKTTQKREPKVKLSDLDCVKPHELEYELLPIFLKDLERRQDDFKVKVLKTYEKIVSRDKLPKNKEILKAYLESLEICS